MRPSSCKNLHTFQPWLHGLEITNYSFIIATGHLRSNDTEDHKVQLPHPRIFPPFGIGVVPECLGDIDIRGCHLDFLNAGKSLAGGDGDPTCGVIRGVKYHISFNVLFSPLLLSISTVISTSQRRVYHHSLSAPITHTSFATC
jgi:hypothetical protein